RLEKVSGAIGGDVILHVGHREISSVSWVLLPEGNIIVETKPGKSIDDKKVRRTQYRGRVRSEDDGSLHIYNLSPEDQRTYNADMQTAEGETCVYYNLTLYERLLPKDLNITHSIISNATCSLSLSCTMDRRDVTITWSHLDNSDINVTQGVLYVSPSNVNITYTCTARNPVSNVSKTVIPGKYCKTGNSKPQYLWILGVIPVLFIILLMYFIDRKGRCKKNDNSTAESQVIILYLIMQNAGDHLRLKNPYLQTQGEQQSFETSYSEVQHVQKTTNSQKNVADKNAKDPDSIYTTVALPDKTANSQNNVADNNAKDPDSVYSTVTLPDV
ncbi:hypothetical protein PRIEUP_LOCUS142, partial [Pristimantis euphronides]